MARERRTRKHEHEEVDLVPLLNLVLILIPLLLLSVVFTEVTVVDVAMPASELGTEPGEPAPKLEVTLGAAGFWIVEGGVAIAPIAGCPPGPHEPTVCRDANAPIADVGTYAWHELYNALLNLKVGAWNDRRTVHLVPEPEVPLGVLVRAMDTVRWQRAPTGEVEVGAAFATGEALEDSTIVTAAMATDGGTGRGAVPLFPDVVLARPR